MRSYRYSNDFYHHGIKGMKWGVRRTPEQLKYNKSSILTALNKNMLKISTVNGILIRDTSPHIADRAEERKVTVKEIVDALKKPLHIKDVKVDMDGFKSQEFIGNEARVFVNPDSGKLVTVWKTSTKLKDKYAKKGK